MSRAERAVSLGLWTLVGLTVLAVAAGRAQEIQEPQEPTDTLAAVQQEMVEAVGGAAAWEAVSAVELRGVRNRNGYEMGLAAWLARPHRVRVEHTLRGQVETFVYDGERGWLERLSDAGTFSPLEPQETRQRLDEVEKYLRWPEVWRRYAEARLDGVEERAGRTVHRLLLVADGGGPAETWLVDRASGRVVEIVEPTVGEDGEQFEVRSFAWDHRDVDGILVPHYVEIDQGTSLYSYEVRSVVVDPPLPEGLFEPAPGPDAGAGDDSGGDPPE